MSGHSSGSSLRLTVMYLSVWTACRGLLSYLCFRSLSVELLLQFSETSTFNLLMFFHYVFANMAFFMTPFLRLLVTHVIFICTHCCYSIFCCFWLMVSVTSFVCLCSIIDPLFILVSCCCLLSREYTCRISSSSFFSYIIPFCW